MTRSVLRGPAVVQFKSQNFYTEGEITVTFGFETTPVETSVYGKVDERVLNRIVEISFTPVNLWGGGGGGFTDKVAVLWPYLTNYSIGSTIFSGTQAAENTVTIWTTAGKKYIFQSGAITKMPQLSLSSQKIMCGPVTITCIEELATTTNAIQAWSVDDSIIDDPSTAATFNLTDFDTTDVLFDTYSAAWGSVSGFTALTDTIDGFTIDFDISLEPQSCDNHGTYDFAIGSLDVSCSFTPLNITPDQVWAAMKMQGTGAARGMSLNGIQSNSTLTISGSASGRPKVLVYGAQLKNSTWRFDRTTPNMGPLDFVATRTYASGATGLLAAISTV
jgi:hypothetical protein